MKPVTVWKRYSDTSRRFEFNHIEDGHVSPLQETPTIKHPDQRRVWTRALWVKKFAWLDENNVVVYQKEAIDG